MFENLSQEDEFLRKAVYIGFALSHLASTSIFALGLCLDMHTNIHIIALMFGILWTHPTTLYLLYHPMTLPLPTWLTSGHPLIIGGITPNICQHSTLELGLEGGGSWPCLPSEFKARLANMAGPEGWKWLVQLDRKAINCLIFLGLNLGILTMLMIDLRKPRPNAERDARGTQQTCALYEKRAIGTETSEPGDCKD